MKINPNDAVLVEACRNEILKLGKQQDAIYNQMIEIIKPQNDYLWDYCFNCSEEDQYTERARKELFNMKNRNNITGDEIKTKPTNSSFRNGWEKAFLKKPQEWVETLYGNSVKMLNADTLIENDEVTWETPMTKKEFQKQFAYCSISGLIIK